MGNADAKSLEIVILKNNVCFDYVHLFSALNFRIE